MSAAASVTGLPRLDKYELLEEIGHGGMATVYRARDPRLGREVAVKLIHRHLRENAEVGTRFVAEARAAAKLRHPAIVDVFDVSNEDDAERYLVVELVRGTTLRKILQRHRDMPAEIGAAIAMRLCAAVEHAHASAIIHRDIKPENVLVELPQDRLPPADAASSTPTPAPVSSNPDSSDEARPSSPSSSDTQASAAIPKGPTSPRKVRELPAHKARTVDPGVVIKITDFGIAKILDAQGVTSTGQVLGSPAHMAPEQIEGGDVDARTDVFALGVLLYECLVGHLPFEGKNPAQVLRRVLDGTYPPADRERPSVGGRWARIIAHALAREPADRIASAAELADRIQAELGALGISDPTAEVATYFADPAGYKSAHPGRLVPVLIARGEAARKAGDVQGAAADWNRALALAPDDISTLKRLGSLTASAGRRQLVRRVAAIVGGSATLGLLAFGVARTVKARTIARAGDPEGPATSATVVDNAVLPQRDVPATPVSAEPHPRNHVLTSASVPLDATGKIPRIAATPTFTPGPPASVVPAAAGVRTVRFSINPKGARLFVDGVERTNWFSQPLQLSVGAHSAEAVPKDEKCCKKRSTTINVEAPPAGKPEAEQIVPLEMEIVPATVVLASTAPAGSRLLCTDVSVNVAAGLPSPVRLRTPEARVSCTFTAPDRPPRQSSLTFRAGETTTATWPE